MSLLLLFNGAIGVGAATHAAGTALTGSGSQFAAALGARGPAQNQNKSAAFYVVHLAGAAGQYGAMAATALVRASILASAKALNKAGGQLGALLNISARAHSAMAGAAGISAASALIALAGVSTASAFAFGVLTASAFIIARMTSSSSGRSFQRLLTSISARLAATSASYAGVRATAAFSAKTLSQARASAASILIFPLAALIQARAYIRTTSSNTTQLHGRGFAAGTIQPLSSYLTALISVVYAHHSTQGLLERAALLRANLQLKLSQSAAAGAAAFLSARALGNALVVSLAVFAAAILGRSRQISAQEATPSAAAFIATRSKHTLSGAAIRPSAAVVLQAAASMLAACSALMSGAVSIFAVSGRASSVCGAVAELTRRTFLGGLKSLATGQARVRPLVLKIAARLGFNTAGLTPPPAPPRPNTLTITPIDVPAGLPPPPDPPNSTINTPFDTDDQ